MIVLTAKRLIVSCDSLKSNVPSAHSVRVFIRIVHFAIYGITFTVSRQRTRPVPILGSLLLLYYTVF